MGLSREIHRKRERTDYEQTDTAFTDHHYVNLSL